MKLEIKNPIVGDFIDASLAMDELYETLRYFGEVNLCEYYDIVGAGKLAEKAAELYGGRNVVYWDNLDGMFMEAVYSPDVKNRFAIRMPGPNIRAVEKCPKIKLKDNRRKKTVRFKDLEAKNTFIMVDYLCMKLDNGDAVNLEDGHLYAVSDGKSTLTPDTLVEPVSATISFE